MKGVFGDLGFQVFGDVLHEANAAASGLDQWAVTTRAGGELVRLLGVDDRGDRTRFSRMAGLGSAFLAVAFGGGFGVRGNGSGGRVWPGVLQLFLAVGFW